MRILVIEDETRMARVIARVLEEERFDVDVRHDGVSGLDAALTGAYDAIVLDRMLPGRDGLEVLRELRREKIATPVLMLTASGDLPERVEGLNAGADDYLGKPFAFEEVLARLRALLRRSVAGAPQETIRIGPVELDMAGRVVRKDGAEIDLSPREFSLLETLARNRGQVLSRDRLLEQVWGYDADPQGNVVDLYVHYLRRKLDPPGAESLIRTVRGAGYAVRGEQE